MLEYEVRGRVFTFAITSSTMKDPGGALKVRKRSSASVDRGYASWRYVGVDGEVRPRTKTSGTWATCRLPVSDQCVSSRCSAGLPAYIENILDDWHLELFKIMEENDQVELFVQTSVPGFQTRDVIIR